ncbi:MAG: efflux RND transporter periplasmic adaptor subunit, partial [Terriglobales bacterium]
MSRFSAALALPCALLGMLLLTAACGSDKAAKAAGDPPAMPVKVHTANLQKVEDATEYVATLKSRDSAVVMPQVEGIITRIFVHSGDRVANGAPLMQIDPSKQQATVKSQEDARTAQVAQVTWAQQNYDRVSGLANAGVVSKQDLDQARATLDAAQAQLHSLDAQVNEQQVQLHYYQVVAPRAGIVGDVPVRVGDRVVTTTQLTTVDRPGTLEAYVYIPIEKSAQLKVNLPVEIVDGSGNLLASSRITFISPQVDNSTQTVLAKA